MRLVLAAFVSLSAAVTSFAQTTWYVDRQNCTGSGSGTAANPFCYIQEGVDAAANGDVVRVMPGTYHEAVLVSGVAITIESAAGAGSTVLRGRQYLPGFFMDHAELVLRGMTITDAWPAIRCADAKLSAYDCVLAANLGAVINPWGNTEGGGLYAVGSQCELERCTVRGNFADWTGGISAYGGRLVLRDSTIALNYGISGQGGVDVQGGRLEVRGGRMIDNDTGDGAGAIGINLGDLVADGVEFRDHSVCESVGTVVAYECNVAVRHCTFSNNYSCFEGGLYISNGRGLRAVVETTVFRDNEGTAGAAMHVDRGDVLVRECSFLGNQVDTFGEGRGGAAYVGAGANVRFERCAFEGNLALPDSWQHGDGAAIWGPAIVHASTFVRNSAEDGGAAVAGGAVLDNCIVWESSDNPLDATSSATWSDIQGGWPGTGNFDADPMLWGPEHGDLHLLPGSPCIDAGDPNLSDDDGTRLDVGAFPFDAGYCGSPGTYCTAKENSASCVPAISWTGTPSVAGPDDFHIVATNVLPDARGILVWGTGASAVPFHGGTLCIAPPRHRSSPLQASSGVPCEGVFDFHFSQALMQTHGLTVGDRLYFQFWYRDPLHSDGTGAGLTDGLEAAICLGS